MAAKVDGVEMLHILWDKCLENEDKGDENAVCVWMCVWVLTRVAQIVTAAHRDLHATNEQ